MIRIAIFLGILIVAATSARADQATAAIAFNQAEALVKENKWAQACALFETSYNADPQLGVLLHLADCHEHIGRLATAWAEFRDAVELARQKRDPRENYAQKRAEDLLPRLSRLHLIPPPEAVSGLRVRRDQVDITALLGSDIPIDTGDHEIVAGAPGHLDWKKKISISGPGTTSIHIPVLTLVPTPGDDGPPAVQEGTLTIVTQPDAEILIDAKQVGTGRFEGALKRGGHTLRVVAKGMRSYQSEINIEAGKSRTIDVVLEERAEVPILPKTPDTDSFELGASMASGVKFRGDRPLIATIRGELALRLGSRVNFGVFAEYGRLSTEGSCGFAMPGPMPETPFDFGPRLQFSSCSYLMPGAQVYVHILPKGELDPYIGVAPGFRFGFADWTPYRDGEAQARRDAFFPAIVVGVRGGLNYHPRSDFAGWEVGAYLEALITLAEDDAPDEFAERDTEFFDAYLSILGGVRTTVAF